MFLLLALKEILAMVNCLQMEEHVTMLHVHDFSAIGWYMQWMNL